MAYFVIFIILLIFLHFKMNKTNFKLDHIKQSFWEKEHEANTTRKKSLENIEYIHPNMDGLPRIEMDECSNELDKKICHVQNEFFHLCSLPMANFYGKNNTDLKLEYGAANLDTLIGYEATYHHLTQSILEWAELLIESNRKQEAIQVLEEGLHVESDLSKNYMLLADLYSELKEQNKLKRLYEKSISSDLPLENSVKNYIKTKFK